jgi:hypothetical protein
MKNRAPGKHDIFFEKLFDIRENIIKVTIMGKI